MITNEHYYRALNIMDRVEELREEKRVSRYEIGKNLKHTGAYYQAFYDACRTIRVSTLVNFAKALDVSVEYLLTGKNKKPYKDFKVDFKIIKENNVKYLPNRLQVIKGRLKRGVCNNLSVKSLFEFENYYKIPANKLLGEE